MEYLIPLLIAIFCSLCWKRLPSGLNTFLYYGLCIYVILLLGLRYRVGIDTLNYMSVYSQHPVWDNFWSSDIFSERFEPGYLFVCAVCKLFSNEFWPAQLVLAAITNICIFIFIHRYCKNPFVGVFFYMILQCLYFTTEIMRESVAVGIFLLNFRNLERQKWVKYYLISLLSIAFHYSAIIIWFFPLVKYLRFNYMYIFLVLGFLAITPLIQNLNELLSFASITLRVDAYLGRAESLNMNWRISSLIKTAFPAVAALVLLRMFRCESKFRQYALLQILFCAGAFAVPLMFSRFTNYTALFVVAIIANLQTDWRIPRFVRNLFVCFVLLTQSIYYNNMRDAWIPYVSIFDPHIVYSRENLWMEFFG